MDEKIGGQILELLKKLSEDTLIVAVTHDRDSAEKYGDRIIEIADGKIVADTAHITAEAINEETVKDEEKSQEKPLSNRKERLSGKRIVSMALQNMNFKKFRLIVTILLFAFSMSCLGMAVSAASYKEVEAAYNFFVENGFDEVLLSVKATDSYDEGMYDIVSNYHTDKIIEEFSEFESEKKYFISELEIATRRVNDFVAATGYTEFCFCESVNVSNFYIFDDEEELNFWGYSLAYGRLPTAVNEVAITLYEYECFKDTSFYEYDINSYDDIIGKSYINDDGDYSWTIVGIVDTGLNLEEFSVLKTIKSDDIIFDVFSEVYKLNVIFEEKVEKAMFLSKDYRRRITSKIVGSDNLARTLEHAKEAGFNVVLKSGTESLGKTDIVLPKRQFSRMVLQKMQDEFMILYNLPPSEVDGERLMFLFNAIQTSVVPASELNAKLEEGIKFWVSEIDAEGFQAGYFNVVGYIDTVYQEREFIVLCDEFINQYPPVQNVMLKLTGDKNTDMRLFTYIYNEEIDKGKELVIRGDAGYVLLQRSMLKPYIVAIGTGAGYVLLQRSMLKPYIVAIGTGAGIAFALFSVVLMLHTFSGIVSGKRKFIGILRALGANGRTVFLLFFTEALIISLISYGLSLLGTGGMMYLMNNVFTMSLIYKSKMFYIGYKVLLSLLTLSVGIAFMGSFLPIYKMSRKKPVDVIRE